MKSLIGPLGQSFAAPGRSLRAFAVFAVFALVIGACGGSDDDEPDASNNGGGGLTPINGDANGNGDNNGDSNGSDVVFTPGALTQLDSFRFEIVVEGAGDLIGGLGEVDELADESERLTFRGSWIAPDQAQVEFDLGGLMIKQTIIGDQEWTSFADISQGPLPATGTAEDLVLVADFVDSSDVLNQAEFDCGGAENINGVSATRCEVSEEAYEGFIEGFTEDSVNVQDATLVIYIAEGGYIVRSELTASGTSVEGDSFSMRMTANVTDINGVNEIVP